MCWCICSTCRETGRQDAVERVSRLHAVPPCQTNLEPVPVDLRHVESSLTHNFLSNGKLDDQVLKHTVHVGRPVPPRSLGVDVLPVPRSLSKVTTSDLKGITLYRCRQPVYLPPESREAAPQKQVRPQGPSQEPTGARTLAVRLAWTRGMTSYSAMVSVRGPDAFGTCSDPQSAGPPACPGDSARCERRGARGQS